MISSDIGEFILSREVLGINDGLSVPETFTLHQNYPNPFNPMIKGDFSIDNSMIINLSIYNRKGELVDKIFHQKIFYPGTHQYLWNAEKVPNGVYILRLETDYDIKSKKIILLK